MHVLFSRIWLNKLPLPGMRFPSQRQSCSGWSSKSRPRGSLAGSARTGNGKALTTQNCGNIPSARHTILIERPMLEIQYLTGYYEQSSPGLCLVPSKGSVLEHKQRTRRPNVPIQVTPMHPGDPTFVRMCCKGWIYRVEVCVLYFGNHVGSLRATLSEDVQSTQPVDRTEQ